MLNGSNNQFIQNNSTQNNFSHKYTSPSKKNEPYFNKSTLNKNKKIFFTKINLIDEDNSSNSLNETHINNYFINIRHTNRENIPKKIINKSLDNSSKYILTERNMKQITGKTSFFDNKNNNNNQNIKNEKKVEIKGDKSLNKKTLITNEENYIRTYSYERRSQRSNTQEKPSSSSLHLINSDNKEDNIKGNNNSSKKIFHAKNEQITRINKDYRKNNNIIVKPKLNNYIKRNEREINYIKYINADLNKDRCNTLESDRNSCHYSLNNIYEQTNKKKKNHNLITITEIKTKKEGLNQKNNTNSSFINNSLNSSPKRITNISTKFSVNTERKRDTSLNNIKTIRNKKNHVMYESKYTKTQKQKEKHITLIIKNTNENNDKENKKMRKSPNYSKITKIIKIKENLNNEIQKDKNKDDKIKNGKINNNKNKGDKIINEKIKIIKLLKG